MVILSEENENDTNSLKSLKVETAIKERVTQARKEEVLGIYEDLLKTIWGRIMPTLGRVTVMAIMERAVSLTRESYPTLEQLEVKSEGMNFEIMRNRLEEGGKSNLREALKDLIANLIDILAMLTGDILVKQLLQEIEGRHI